MSGRPFNLRQRLLELRESVGLYQEEAAELLDLPYKTYQAIEGGRRVAVRLDTLEKLAQGYDLELWQLFHPDAPTLPKRCLERGQKLVQLRVAKRKKR